MFQVPTCRAFQRFIPCLAPWACAASTPHQRIPKQAGGRGALPCLRGRGPAFFELQQQSVAGLPGADVSEEPMAGQAPRQTSGCALTLTLSN